MINAGCVCVCVFVCVCRKGYLEVVVFALRHVELVTGLIARKKVAQHTTAPQSHLHTCTAVCECAECVCACM